MTLDLSGKIHKEATVWCSKAATSDVLIDPDPPLQLQEFEMRVLVTGCGGFLGREVVRQLLDRGDTVLGVSRSVYPELTSAGMQHCRGDLSDPLFTTKAIREVDAVVHTAAVAGVWGRGDHFVRNNVTATENVIQACRKNHINKLVFTSSPSVTFDGSHQRGIDEATPYPEKWLCHYPRTKAIAEKKVLDAHTENDLQTLALRPHLIWGEDDPHILPRILQRAALGRLRIVGDGTNRVDTVHVVNAAAAHLDGIDALHHSPKTAGGRAYFIAQDEPVECWDWIREVCRIGGVPEPQKKISCSAAYRLGAMMEVAYYVLGKKNEPPMTRFVAAQLAKDHYFNIEAAKQQIGYRTRLTMSEGLDRLRTAWHSRPPIY